jgi:pimeloyl-ACP methyl ester carboxylesterase
MKLIKRWWWVPVLLLLIVLGGFVIWAETPLGPSAEALQATRSNTEVTVDTRGWLVFKPVGKEPTTGFIFYPGGRVDARSYAPPARAIAAAGYMVVIVPMPLNLAVTAPEKASEVIAAYPQVEKWAIGGHSLGGAMAANYAYKHPDQIDGLVLWASYPASNNDLSGATLPVLSIYGSMDGVANKDKIDSSRSLLPKDTNWVVIDGGNHGQFGSYGQQPGDNVAQITPEEQQQQVVEATTAFLEGLGR